MQDSLYIGATGMQAQQRNVDTIANNLANVNTPGFKRSRVEFTDLLARSQPATQAQGAEVPATTESGGRGIGSAVTGVSKVFTAGDLKKTGEALDVAINGMGLFEVALADGRIAYTRNGSLRVSAEGYLVTSDGHKLGANLQVPADATAVRIDGDGKVFVTLPNENRPNEIGQIELAMVPNPGGLEPIGDNLYVLNDRAGAVTMVKPGEGGSGALSQGFLEAANVRLIDELVGLIVAQRAYELNAKVVQASDEMLSQANNLYR